MYKLNIHIMSKLMVYSVNRDRVKWAREGCPRNGNYKTKIFSHNQQNECKGLCTSTYINLITIEETENTLLF